MNKTTLEAVEKAVKEIKELKIQASEINGKIKDNEAVIEAYSVEHLSDFSDGRLSLSTGIIAVKAGQAKPVKEGKPLSTAARAELATVLPPAYVKMACDYSILYDIKDKMVRQILRSRGIEIVREDKFTVI